MKKIWTVLFVLAGQGPERGEIGVQGECARMHLWIH